MALTAEEVTWCYRLLLGREPISPAAIEEHLRVAADRDALVKAFMNSDEFHVRHGSASAPFRSTPGTLVRDVPFRLESSCPAEASTAEELKAIVDTFPWFHTIDLGRLVTPGNKSSTVLASEADAFFGDLDLHGRSFLDIGAWNGYFSFEAKRRGAARVLATDSFTWRHPDFRGLEAFLLARRELGLDIDAHTVTVEDLHLELVPRDVVLFSGVFYHLYDPIRGMESVSKVTGDLMILETHQDALENQRPAMIFYPGTELADDPTNWWGPNVACTYELLRSVGFPIVYYRDDAYYGRQRGIFHAFRSREAMQRIAPAIGSRAADLSVPGALARFIGESPGGGIVPAPQTEAAAVDPGKAETSLTAADVVSAYRFVLGREPDPSGQAHYLGMINRVIPTWQSLRNHFVGSSEFHRLASAVIGHDLIYAGYSADDASRIRCLMPAAHEADPRFYTDAFGQKFDAALHPRIADRVGSVSTALPLPGDGHLSEGIEYAAVALAFEAAFGRSRFAAAEVGAGWGPWTTLFGLVARRLGFEEIGLAAFEADPGRFQLLRRHLASNGLIDADSPNLGAGPLMRWKLFNAAIAAETGVALWPRNEDVHDACMRVESPDQNSKVDYQGIERQFMEIPAIGIAEALADLAPLDILHIDIQGGEADLLPLILDFLDANVRSTFVSTHSRKIEGDLVELFYARGWELLREKPCRFDPGSGAPTLDGKTVCSGAQYWRNPRIR